MTDDEQAFVTAARFLLRDHRPPVTDALLAHYRGDHARLSSASLPLLIALDDACPLDTDADFDLSLAIHRAMDARAVEDWERALVEALPPPDEFDANADAAWEIKVVLHPVHGVGLLDLEPTDTYGWRARVRFRDGERTFADARWSHPTRLFMREAGLLLASKVESASEDAFWPIVNTIDWGSGRPIQELAAALSKRVSYVECIALHGAAFDLGRPLKKRIEAWEASRGEKLPCGDDSFGDLAYHIIGLGRATYLATIEDPALAMARAEARDYRESFTYVFQYAEGMYPADEVVRALRALAPEKLVEDPALGVGFPASGDQTAFVTRTLPR